MAGEKTVSRDPWRRSVIIKEDMEAISNLDKSVKQRNQGSVNPVTV
ncbi:hypothetical protein COLO4_28019 [Corchorus olitorius]|uniref:Uncharacterized protein n=1 Tax=Corchorus olitorius TaxID=93759 RepID=A0A1R3HNC3_9ROSI|nr:hypothetical protein COLO4_28019 [Corchorus olitorius]